MIPIFRPYMPENINSEVATILYSGKLSYGERGAEFEEKLSAYIGCKKVLTISSYNLALLVILSTLDLKPGDEIIASPVSCLASNQPFAVKGLKVVWADINPTTGTLLVDDVRKRITSKTKAIFHNHYCGYLGDVVAMNSLGKEFGIPVIDDCIEAFGSELDGRKTGNLGTDITVFSFQTVRLPNTIEGGAIVFTNDEMYERARLIRDYGIDRIRFRDELNEISGDCDVSTEGYGALLGELNSYIGIRQLEDIDILLERQRENARLWRKNIFDYDTIQELPAREGSIPNGWVYGVMAKDKNKAIRDFRSQNYYATGVHINNNIYSVFDNKTDLIGVNEFIRCFVALPSGWWVTL